MSEPRQKILIVDDRPQNLYSLKKTLEVLDAEIVSARSGNEALKATLSHTFSLAILDVQMPEMDGYELAEYLRGDPTTQHLPIIFLTAFTGSDEHALKGFEAGAVDYIVKPFNPRLLVSKARVFLELDSNRRELVRHRDQLKAAMEKAEAASHAKSAFLANMSHEIRTPLNAVLGYVQLLVREPGLSARQRAYLDIVERSGDHLLGLLNDLLEMSRIEAGRTTLTSAPFDFRQMMSDVEWMFRYKTQQKGVGLLVQAPPDSARYLDADSGKIRQVLINLVGNAVKFTESGRIRIGSAVEQAAGRNQLKVTLFVEDTGCGIGPDDLARIFQPFEQAIGGAAKGGAGLGLAISQRFAQMMGGTLTATSSPGKGSTFRFTFLAGVADPLTVLPRISKGRVVRLRPEHTGIRVLVVDDQEAGRDLLETFLSSVGYDVRQAPNGAEALKVFDQWAPHLVVTDKLMPVMDGVELARAIKSRQSGAGIPIVMVSGSTSEGEAREILRNDVSAFLPKPMDARLLYAEVGRLLAVEYEYEMPTLPAPQAHPESGETLLPSHPLDGVPSALRDRLASALSQRCLKEVLECLEQVESLHPELGHTLRNMGEELRYEEISSLLGKQT